jgi:serine protease Do
VGRRGPHGSGFVLAAGQVVTNAHNLRADHATITFPGGRSEQAAVTGFDLDGDLAVLEVDTGDSAPLELSSEAAGIGQPVVALANPGGIGLRVTVGSVSGVERAFRGPRGRRIAGGLEHTAPLLPGSSGGPVVDVHGRVLGINTHRLGEGFYLAIPAAAGLGDRLSSLAEGEAPVTAWMGVGVAPSHVAARLRKAVGLPEREGLLVRVVSEDGPAATAGIREGDLLVIVDGRTPLDGDGLHEILRAHRPGDRIDVTVVRGTEDLSVEIELGEPGR